MKAPDVYRLNAYETPARGVGVDFDAGTVFETNGVVPARSVGRAMVYLTQREARILLDRLRRVVDQPAAQRRQSPRGVYRRRRTKKAS